ncbi:HesB/YadR/YfhF-family protein [Desulfovibrio sp. X2]|uniref:IscA/HesB family protein n=1 Tax=Desulfovibrio sp. X2 TaxID=941449 RepID=UPI000358F1FF|nr:IscA/HesB family protein [Desulfovibrio sp. X2]EPR42462.1 HesB/YadR/YfhF-family protein [Desulfovibrio sp. X2]
MITMTPQAKEKIDQYFADKDVQTIRVFLSQGGCSGPFLGLALDDAKDADETFVVDGYTFAVDKELLEQAKPIAIDMGPMGFSISSSLVFERSGCGCSSCGTGGCSC